MKTMRRISRVAMVVLVAIICNTSILLGQDAGATYTISSMRDASYAFHSPDAFTSWLARNFKYAMKYPDNPQSADELIRTKVGDCDDFANLSSQILSNMNIANKIIILRFHGISIKHAVCIFREKGGTYSLISNRELIRTAETSIDGALKQVYPDCVETEEINDRRYS